MTDAIIVQCTASSRDEARTIARTIVEHHGYEVPEIVALPVLAGHQAYLDWITESVRAGEAES
jgi:periplasmic divalent cation tolerance protein